MFIGQSVRITGIHGNDIFHRLIWYIKNVAQFILLPWMVLLFFVIAVLVAEWAAGDLGRNGGMTGLFQSVGLHPHMTYEVFLWITGFGVFFAVVWLLWRVFVALFEAAGHQMQKAVMKQWIARKAAPLRNVIAHFENSLPSIFIALVTTLLIVVAVFVAMPSTPRSQMIVWPPAGPQIVQASPYSSVLLRVPNSPDPKAKGAIPTHMIPAPHAISGKAIVTKIGPHVYQVRMIP
ncbi:MAG: hypothetical protein ACYCQL_09760 [Acidithiobacillus sp.]